MNKNIIDIKQLSNYLKISDSEIRKLVRSHRIPYFRIGNRLKFDLNKIDKWIDTLHAIEDDKHINPLSLLMGTD